MVYSTCTSSLALPRNMLHATSGLHAHVLACNPMQMPSACMNLDCRYVQSLSVQVSHLQSRSSRLLAASMKFTLCSLHIL